jgi:hypothetical protein
MCTRLAGRREYHGRKASLPSNDHVLLDCFQLRICGKCDPEHQKRYHHQHHESSASLQPGDPAASPGDSQSLMVPGLNSADRSTRFTARNASSGLTFAGSSAVEPQQHNFRWAAFAPDFAFKDEKERIADDSVQMLSCKQRCFAAKQEVCHGCLIQS